MMNPITAFWLGFWIVVILGLWVIKYNE